jgi:hypothetical protein
MLLGSPPEGGMSRTLLGSPPEGGVSRSGMSRAACKEG